MAKVISSEEAERWLSSIFEYITVDNPGAAERTVQGIYDRAQAPRDFPHLGYRYRASPRQVRILFPTWMIEGLDREAGRLGVTRQSIIKVWLAERLRGSASNQSIQPDAQQAGRR